MRTILVALRLFTGLLWYLDLNELYEIYPMMSWLYYAGEDFYRNWSPSYRSLGIMLPLRSLTLMWIKNNSQSLPDSFWSKHMKQLLFSKPSLSSFQQILSQVAGYNLKQEFWAYIFLFFGRPNDLLLISWWYRSFTFVILYPSIRYTCFCTELDIYR